MRQHFVISAVWAGTVFGLRLWQLSAPQRSVAEHIYGILEYFIVVLDDAYALLEYSYVTLYKIQLKKSYFWRVSEV